MGKLLRILASLLAANALGGCFLSSSGPVARVEVYDDAPPGGPARPEWLTVRLLLEEPRDPLHLFILQLDLDEDGEADHVYQARHSMEQGRWVTYGTASRESSPMREADERVLYWQLPFGVMQGVGERFAFWLEVVTPRRTYRLPPEGSQVYHCGKPGQFLEAIEAR